MKKNPKISSAASLKHPNNDLFASKLKLKLKRHYQKITPTRSMLLITGAFVSHTCWDEWKAYFGSKGYRVQAPPWPHKDATVQILNAKHPQHTDLANLTLKELIDHYTDLIKALPEKPIVIGHGLGGLIAQIIVNRDLAAAGIAIHSVPPPGIFPYDLAYIKAGWKSLGLLSPLKETYLMSFKDWQYGFVNEMPLAEQRRAYEKYVIPESKTVIRGGLSSAAKIDFDKMHVPLLLIAGKKDHFTSAHMNLRNYKKYKRNGSVVHYKAFEGRSHFVPGHPAWKEDADFILQWIKSLL